MAVPRMMARAGSFAFITVPERLDSILGFRNGGSMIAEATGNGSVNIISSAFFAGSSSGTATPTAAAAAGGTPEGLGTFSFQQVRNFSGIFAYMTSKWALACFTLAVILNRTQIYASARRHITLSWPVRLALRLMPIIMFLAHTLSLLQAMRCQTAPNYSYLRYGKADKHIDWDFSGDNGIIYYISSVLLFWETDSESCRAVDMIPSRSEVWDRRGSLALLWPFFQSLCLGQFVETLLCAIQGRHLMTETGMSIFEHSLAFAEAEAMISNQLGLSLWSTPKAAKDRILAPSEEQSVTQLFTRSQILDKMNTPPEVLLMGLISSLNNLSSQLLGVLNMQARYRLVNTGIWGLCFMVAFMWGLLSLRPESGPESIILRFPTVCIIGFIPHLLILVGIILCAFIYSLALLLCFLSPPTDGPPPRSLAHRFRLARENMMANSQLSSIRLDMHEDFYTALLKIGFTALTVASEAVFLNEGKRVSVARLTWLEEERLKEVEALGQYSDPADGLTVRLEAPNSSVATNQVSTRPWASGYKRPISVTAERLGPSFTGSSRPRGDGVGHMQRGGRYLMAMRLFRGIFWLIVNWSRLIANKVLDKAGIARRPQWLNLPKSNETSPQNGDSGRCQPETLDFWLLSDDDTLSLPENDNVDVEQEIKRRIKNNENDRWGEEQEQILDARVYDWWANGGWFGDKDESGSYQASIQDDDDATSIISVSTDASETSRDDAGSAFEEVDSGASTPTQRDPFAHRPYTRNLSMTLDQISVPDLAQNPAYNGDQLDPHHLAALLNPKNQQQRSEARMLAHHLTAPTITTRSKYRHAQSFANAKLLTSTRYRPSIPTIPSTGPLSPDEEAQLLEQIIITRRSQPNLSDQAPQTWRDGAVGMGAGGPQCVVCQSAPRTVLSWPCRCLSLCEECRVNLAMNNFGTCVCCRQDVVGFSRLFVP